MATAHYNEKRQGWELNWVDEKKKKEGHKKPYGRKFITDRTYPTLRKKEKELVRNKWLNEALKQEKNCRCLINGADLNKEISALAYLRETEKVAKSGSCERTIKNNSRHLRFFCDWLEEKYPNLMLHQINNAIAIEYLKEEAQSHKTSTVEGYRKSLQYIIGLVVTQMEDSDLKYRNGFAKLSLDDILTSMTEKHKKDRYEVQQIKRIIVMATYKKFTQAVDVLIIMWLTGWRISDVLNLRESQIDWEKSTLTLYFQKSINSTKQNVTIPLLSPLREIFIRLKKSKSKHSDVEFFFPKYSDIYQKTGDWRRANKWRKEFYKICDSSGGHNPKKTYKRDNGSAVKMRCLTPHSVRGAVISTLTECGYVEPLINHLVGHSSGSINQKHYMTFDEKSVKPMMETMRELLKDVIWDKEKGWYSPASLDPKKDKIIIENLCRRYYPYLFLKN